MRIPGYRVEGIACLFLLLLGAGRITAQPGNIGHSGVHSAQTIAPREKLKVIFDTDIGDDIDDAFALALLISRPEVEVLGVTTAWGDTALRARLTERFLASAGKAEIPIFTGPKTVESTVFSQERYALGDVHPAAWPDAIAFTLDAIRRDPGEITLIAVAPFSNMGALIDRDPVTFRKLKRVVLMGGSIHRGYGDLGYSTHPHPTPEYNVFSDVASSRKLLASGVPISMMPLDSTQLKLDEVKRDLVFSHGTPLTDALTLLYHQWSASTGTPTPTLYDAMAAAAAIRPELCPTTPMHLRIDDKGNTIPEAGPANADVCLESDSEQFFRFYLTSILANPPAGNAKSPD
ncbi:MAG TPA: nucleoside hydrolase [Acidisarcina sp.]|nr:nucleoside hydrolase [Acidisarcina sp.]